MADTIERIYKLTVDGTAAARQLGEIERATSALDARMASSVNGIKAFGAALAGAVSVGAIVSSIQRNIDAMDDLSKAVSKVGVAAEDLQRLRYAADLSGLSAEQLDKAISSVAVGMSDLATGTDATAKALRRLGAESGEDVLTTLKKISDQFQSMPDGVAKTALAIDLFGKKVGPDMIPLLNAGGDALQELANEADKFGGVLTGGTLQAAEAFNDNMSRMQRTTAGISAQITAGLLPMLVAMTNDLTGAAKAGDGFVGTGQAIGEVLVEIYGFGLKASATLKALGTVLAGLAAAATNPMQAGTILSMMIDDVDQIGADTNKRLAELADNIKKVQEAAAGPGERPNISGAVDRTDELAKAADKAQKEADKLAKEALKAEKAMQDLIRSLDPAGAAAEDMAKKLGQAHELFLAGRISGEQYTRMIEQLTGVYDPMGEAADRAAKKTQDLIDSLDPAGAAAEAFFKKLADIESVSEEVGPERTRSMEKQARESLGGDKIKDELTILEEGFGSFFENLSSGAADFEDVFKRMVQSIIAELLKLWAKKYIVDAIAGAFGFGASPASASVPVVATSAAPFTSVGVMSQSLSPLTMSTDGGSVSAFGAASSSGLGLASEQQPMQVVINNNAPNVQVETNPTPQGLEVIISQVKASMTADILRGGNDVSHAAERAWGLSRGSAAAF